MPATPRRPGSAKRGPALRGDRTFAKPPLNHSQLLERLQARGLVVPDQARALRYIQTIGYYRLSPYTIPFQTGTSSHRMRPGTTFDDVLELYIFDRKLRLLVLDGLERVEVAVRAALTDHMATTTGDSHWYVNSAHFSCPNKHQRLLKVVQGKVNEQLDRLGHPSMSRRTTLAYPSALEHYVSEYGSPELPPSWVVVEELTIGQLQATIANLARRSDKTGVAAPLGITAALINSWLRAFVRVRNICAHHGRLWNTGLGVHPVLPDSPKVQWLQDRTVLTGEGNFGRRQSLYPVLVATASILKRIAPRSSWRQRLIHLIDAHPNVPRSPMGLPPGWQHDAFWAG